MADRFEVFNVTVPGGIAQATPQRTSLVFSDGEVTLIDVIVPPGPSGFSGFRFDYGGQQIVPDTPGSFIVTDNELISWPQTNRPTGKQWQFVAFNTDTFEHTYRVRFHINEFRPPPAPPVRILATGETVSTGDVPIESLTEEQQLSLSGITEEELALLEELTQDETDDTESPIRREGRGR